MKTVLLLFFALQISASTVTAQRVTLHLKNASFWDAMTMIQKQSGMPYMYNRTIHQLAKPVTIDVDQVTVEYALNEIFKHQELSYSFVEGYFVIKPKTVKTLPAAPVAEQPNRRTIKGKVTDSNGQPLPGVTIRVRGTNLGTTSDANGNFHLDCDADAYLMFSFVGYQSMEVSTNEREFIRVALVELTGMLEETVVKGYYNTTKALNTGNVSTVKGEALSRQVIGDPVLGLNGQVSGLAITQTNGLPGSEFKVRIRGQNSIANGNEPLYIVDGVPYVSTSMYSGLGTGVQAVGQASPFSALRINDIESIDVLKDADATAIYGSRGANGVVLITTKKGKEGKTQFNVNVYQGAGKVTHTLDLMNTEQYLNMRRQAFKNDGASPGATDYDLNGTWDQKNYTDWQKTLLGGRAKVTNGQVSLSGGNRLTQFRLAAGYRRESTVYPGDFRDVKGSGQASINHKSENDRLQASFNLSYVNDENIMPIIDFTSNILLPPNTPNTYNPDGSLNWEKGTWENPLWQTRLTNTGKTDNLNAALNLDYAIVKGLKFTARLGYNDVRLEYSNLNPSNDNPYVQQFPSNRTNSFGNNHTKTWIIEPGFSYSKVLGPGRLDALVGTTFQQSLTRGISQVAKGFNSNEQISNVGYASTVTVTGTNYAKYRYNAIYARLGYIIRDKYVLNLTGRRDGSSRFGPDHRFGNFGAVGGAWIFSKEPFLNLPFLSFGKLRASYGITGNDQLENYKYLSTYSPYPGGFQGNPTLVPSQLTNPIYGWESVKKLEIAVDLGLFKDRLQLNTSIYRHRTGNQLVGLNLPAITGFNTVTANLPAVLQNSGIEFDLKTRNIEKEGFSWSTSFNLSIPKNRLVSYPDLQSSSYANYYVLGRPLSLYFVFHNTGVDPNTGLFKFEDFDGDGKISYEGDRKDVFIGQRYFGGITNNLSYKNFSLDFLITFAKQNGFDAIPFMAPGMLLLPFSNQKAAIIDQINSKNFPPYTTSFGSDAYANYAQYLNSDASIVDASYIRLKNVSLSYRLPERLQKAIKLNNARIYVQAQNLFTITGYKGLDPETLQTYPATFQLPSLKMYSIGIDLTF